MRVTVEDDDDIRSSSASEAGRRAGWAKFFDAAGRADRAEHDVNILRYDNKLLANFSARMYGIIEALVGRNRMNEVFRGDNHELKTYLPQGMLDQGRDAGRKLLGKKADELNRMRQDIEDMKAEHYVLSRKAFTAAMHESRRELLEQFGIPDEDALLEWLARYPHD